MSRELSRPLALSLLVAVLSVSPATAGPSVEIKWDTYGVPHVAADDEDALFYGFGWAQMHSHRNLLLRLYGRARGRAAEYWGKEQVPSDALVRSLSVPQNAQAAYAAQEPRFRQRLDSFVAGMNAYAAAHPDAIDPDNRSVLPLVGTDLFAHLQVVIELGFIGRATLRREEVSIPVGSNAAAIAPARTESGNALLLINPHLPWSGLHTLYEAHFQTRGRNLYGAALVGLPVLTMGFNDVLGWAHTANNVDGADLFEVQTVDEDNYVFGGRKTAFRRRAEEVKVRDKDAVGTAHVRIAETVHGPVLWRGDGKAYAYRSTRALYPRLFQQYWEMLNATGLKEFERALRRMQLPLFNVIYADRAGHILFLWGGLLPERRLGAYDFWAGVVPGSDPRTLWTKTLPYKRLPRLVDPPTGWIQNTNDAPWTSTWPALLKASAHPAYVAAGRGPELRSQQMLNALRGAPATSFEALKALRFRNRMEIADRLLDDLLAAIDAAPPDTPRKDVLDECRRVLGEWNREVDADSRGALLFTAWVVHMEGDPFSQVQGPQNLLTAPRGLKSGALGLERLLASADYVRKKYGSLDPRWGDVYRLKRGTVDVPANGGPDFLGIMQTLEFGETSPGKFQARSGDSYSAIVEFSRPVRAEVLLSYGNSSESSSPNFGDQLALLSAQQMRPALLTDAQIEANLRSRERLTPTR